LNLVLVCVLAYVVVQLALGVAVSRWIATEDDYLLAGRRLGYGLGTMTIFATWFGAETCIGASGRIYRQGLAGGTADPFGYSLGILFMGLFFAAPLWNRRLTTIADLYRTRYSSAVERFAVILMIPGSVLWAAAQIRAFGQVLTVSSEVPLGIGITVAAAVVVAYTARGGMFADAVTDLLQGLVLALGLVMVLFSLLGRFGSLGAAWSSIPPARLDPLSASATSPLEVINSWLIPIVGSLVAQELISRTLAVRSATIARRCCFLATALYLAIGMVPVTIGLVGHGLITDIDPENADAFFPAVAQLCLPRWLYIIFAGALVSAILSTVDSALLVAGSLAGHNILHTFARSWEERTKLRITRACVVTAGLVAYFIALLSDKSSIDIVLEAAQFGSAGIFIVQTFGLFTRFGGNWTAGTTLLVGVVVWLIGHYVVESPIAFLMAVAAALANYATVGTFEGLICGLAPTHADRLDRSGGSPE
jgi:Na+/proline symporter